MFFVCLSPVLTMPPSVSIPINGQKTVIKQLRINIWYFSRPYFHGTHITEIHLFNTYELICVVRIWWPDLLLSTTIQAGRNGSPVLYTVLGYLFYFIFKFCCCCCCWCLLFHKIYNNVFVFSARRWKIWRACCHRDISWDFMKVKMTQTQHSASIRICVIRKKMCMKDAIAFVQPWSRPILASTSSPTSKHLTPHGIYSFIHSCVNVVQLETDLLYDALHTMNYYYYTLLFSSSVFIFIWHRALCPSHWAETAHLTFTAYIYRLLCYSQADIDHF